MEKTELVHKITAFLAKIGINSHFCSIERTTFLPGLHIEKGELLIDMEKLLYPGDLLHEAGHIAVIENANRATASDEDFANPGEEIVAILWSFAVAKELSLPLNVLFHEDGYKGQSDWLIENFENQNFIGLPLLEWMGMTAGEAKAQSLNIAPFPNMIKWLRD